MFQRMLNLETVGRTRKWTTEILLLISHDDALHRNVSTSSKEEKTDEDNDDVKNKSAKSPDSSTRDIVLTIVGLPHANVGDPPKDEAEEGIEEGAQQR